MSATKAQLSIKRLSIKMYVKTSQITFRTLNHHLLPFQTLHTFMHGGCILFCKHGFSLRISNAHIEPQTSLFSFTTRGLSSTEQMKKNDQKTLLFSIFTEMSFSVGEKSTPGGTVERSSSSLPFPLPWSETCDSGGALFTAVSLDTESGSGF